MSGSREILSGDTRGLEGVIVSFSNDAGEWRTLLSQGGKNQLEALADCCHRIARYPGRGYVEAVSTPQSVYRDVTGRSRGGVAAMYAERTMLSRIGRRDMLRVPLAQPGRGRDSARDPLFPSGHAWRKIARANFAFRRRRRKDDA